MLKCRVGTPQAEEVADRTSKAIKPLTEVPGGIGFAATNFISDVDEYRSKKLLPALAEVVNAYRLEVPSIVGGTSGGMNKMQLPTMWVPLVIAQAARTNESAPPGSVRLRRWPFGNGRQTASASSLCCLGRHGPATSVRGRCCC